MKAHWSIVIVAGLAVGAIGWSSARGADDQNKPTIGQKVENAADKTGEAIKEGTYKTERALGLKKDASAYQTEHAAKIQSVLAQVADAALTKKGLDDMAERFSDADRDRINQNKDALKDAELDGRVDQFQKDWKAKYNESFDVHKNYDKIFDQSFASITESDNTRARTAGERVRGSDVNAPADTTTPPTNTGAAPAADRTAEGKLTATVHIAASHNMPALDVPMIHENMIKGWKLDIPDSVDATKLRDNVKAALTHCDDMKDQWSSDVNDAYRAVTHSVLLAVFDQKADQGAQPAAGQLPADQGTTPAQPAQPAK